MQKQTFFSNVTLYFYQKGTFPPVTLNYDLDLQILPS